MNLRRYTQSNASNKALESAEGINATHDSEGCYEGWMSENHRNRWRQASLPRPLSRLRSTLKRNLHAQKGAAVLYYRFSSVIFIVFNVYGRGRHKICLWSYLPKDIWRPGDNPMTSYSLRLWRAGPGLNVGRTFPGAMWLPEHGKRGRKELGSFKQGWCRRGRCRVPQVLRQIAVICSCTKEKGRKKKRKNKKENAKKWGGKCPATLSTPTPLRFSKKRKSRQRATCSVS